MATIEEFKADIKKMKASLDQYREVYGTSCAPAEAFYAQAGWALEGGFFPAFKGFRREFYRALLEAPSEAQGE